MHIRRLREKMNKSERTKYVHTKWGVGYSISKGLGKRIKSMRFYLFLLIFLAGIIPAFIIKRDDNPLHRRKTRQPKDDGAETAVQLWRIELGAEASLQMVLANSEGLQSIQLDFRDVQRASSFN